MSMSALDEEMIRMYKVRRTIMQMLNDRGYLVSDDEINMTQQQFQELYGEDMNKEKLFNHKVMRDNSSDQIYVFFVLPDPSKKTIGVAQVKNYLLKMLSDSVFKAILMVGTKLSHYAQKAFSERPSLTVEVFEEEELIVNILEHELVPEHQVLTDEKKKALLDKYTVKESQLPRMLVTDPVARYFGLKRGKVLKITRPSENTSKYVTYRLVM